jgi:hypothetical protein
VGVNCMKLVSGTVSFEYGNESSGSIKDGLFLRVSF